MALLIVNKEDLYRFQSIEDAELWMDMHLKDTKDVVIVPESDEAADFIDFLAEEFPITIIKHT